MDWREETKKFYNATAAQSFTEWFDNPALLPTLTTFVSHLPLSPRVLDLGCGTGGESKRLASLGARVIGIDYSEASLAFAQAHVPDVEFFLMDLMTMAFPPSTFDGVVEAGVLFHFPQSEQTQILRDIYRMLTPTGRLLSYYPQGEFEGLQEHTMDTETYRRYTRFLPIQKWIDQVVREGFTAYTRYEFQIGSFACVEFIC